MRLLIIGAGGDAGSRIQAEAHRRGHDVTPASRRPRVSSWMRIDAADPDRVEAACREHDVLIASTRPGAGREGEVVDVARGLARGAGRAATDRKSTRLNSSHVAISYAVFCLKKKKKNE